MQPISEVDNGIPIRDHHLRNNSVIPIWSSRRLHYWNPYIKKMTPVVIRWLDAVNHGDGEGLPRHRPAAQQAIGWLLKYDSEGISYCSEYSEDDGSWRDEVFIRNADIISVHEFTE